MRKTNRSRLRRMDVREPGTVRRGSCSRGERAHPLHPCRGSAARQTGALTIGFANNPDTPLLFVSEHLFFCAQVPRCWPARRGGARNGTESRSQPLLDAVDDPPRQVFRGRMVDMRPTNAKLKQRARRIVQDVVGCSPDEATRALEAAGGSIREAILSLEAAR